LEPHRLRDVIDAIEKTGALFTRDRDEVDVPVGRLRLEKVQETSSHAANRGDGHFAGPDRLSEGGRLKDVGPAHHGRDIVDLTCDRTYARAVRHVMRSGKTVLGTVDEKVDVALRPSFHGLGAVASGQFEAKLTQQSGQGSGMGLIDGKFDKGHI